ncbi:MAG: hypothetical protein JXR51_05200 [Bacteroidales bacterium]|nr:hypothetical protein [Bacteroidales bacterium]MBN2756556.1 hypothetical protein [Bacteroidales bacterium]
MLPKKELNIYPKTKENLEALFSFYFDKYDLQNGNAIEKMMELKSIKLNQIEFIARKLSESYNEIFKDFFKNKTTIGNLMCYGIDGLTKTENEWSFGPTSSARPIMKKFIGFVRRTEIDYVFLEKNN